MRGVYSAEESIDRLLDCNINVYDFDYASFGIF
jgi:hypothetical protein